LAIELLGGLLAGADVSVTTGRAIIELYDYGHFRHRDSASRQHRWQRCRDGRELCCQIIRRQQWPRRTTYHSDRHDSLGELQLRQSPDDRRQHQRGQRTGSLRSYARATDFRNSQRLRRRFPHIEVAAGLYQHYARSSSCRVNSFSTWPVFSVVAGSNRTTQHSSSPTGRCSTPRGTTINSPSSIHSWRSRKSMRKRPFTTRNISSSFS